MLLHQWDTHEDVTYSHQECRTCQHHAYKAMKEPELKHAGTSLFLAQQERMHAW
jgi:hypothetical protein